MSLIDQYILKKREAETKTREPGVFWVTDLVKPCLRAAYYDVTAPKKPPIETLRVFEAGDILEAYWVKVLEEREDIRILAIQLPVKFKIEEYEIHGRLDVLTQHDDGALFVHEIKTAKRSTFLEEAKPEHTAQLQFYLNVLGVEYGELDYLDKQAWLTGDDRIDNCFIIRRDRNVFNRLLQRAHQLSQAVKRGEPPEPQPGWLCDYCLHREECGQG